MDKQDFEQWAIIEIMGHQRYAGLVTEQVIGGASFVRVDVPGVNESQPFSKCFGASAIYAITFVDEETATLAAASFSKKPIEEWSAREMIYRLDAPKGSDNQEEIPY